MEKSPLTLSPARISGVVPVLESVRLLLPLVVPTFCVPNVSARGCSDARGLMVVAFSATV